MNQHWTSRLRFVVRGGVVAAALAMCCSTVSAQGGGGGGGAGGGGGGAGGGGAGGGGAGGGGTTTGGGGSSANIFGSAGTATGQSKTKTGTTYANAVSTTNPFQPYMSSPLVAGSALGLQLKSQNSFSIDSTTQNASTVVTNAGKFGTVLSAATTTTGAKGGTTGGAAGGQTSNAGTGFTTVGMVRKPQYVTVADPRILTGTNLNPVQVQASVRVAFGDGAVFEGSRNLAATVNQQPNTPMEVVLTGIVATESDRRDAERLARLTPGVQFIRNEITVAPPPEAK